jgi:photosystem II stability/assembly factor-like uncharacterized protein
MHDPESFAAGEHERGAERIERSVGNIALVAAVVLLGGYLWISYESKIAPKPVGVKMLTQHDELFSVSFPSANDGWVVGKFGMILHTVDGGQTWREQDSGTQNALSSISFVDDDHGVAVGSAGTVIVTNDGGQTWKPQNSGIHDQLLSVKALSPKLAFAVGAYGTVLSTHDGATWQKQTFSWNQLIPKVITDIGPMEPNLSSVFFLDPENGWISGEFGLILHTSDGGSTWNTQRYGKDLPQLYGIAFRDAQNGWAVGQFGKMVVTSDGGQQWKPIELGINTDLYAIAFKGERGIAVGDGVVMVSTDAGATWNQLKSFQRNIWLSGVATDGKSTFAVGQAGFIGRLDRDSGGQLQQ